MHKIKIFNPSNITLAALLLAGCHTEPTTPPMCYDCGYVAWPPPPPRNVTPAVPHVEALNPAEASVYFDFDSYVIKPAYAQLIGMQAKYLWKNPSHKISIVGNTDERGSAEYNLALGRKRAEAVRKALATMGVADSQMEAVSYGKSRPKAVGHDEVA